jgi:hypothetical protein
MPTVNEQILDRYIRHQTYLLRYAGGLRNQVLPDLAATELVLYDAIIAWITKAENNRTLTGKAGKKWQRDFEAALRKIRTPAWDKVSTEIEKQLKELAVAEASSAATVIESSVPVVLSMQLPPASQLVGIVNSQPFQGRTLKEWLKRSAESDLLHILTEAKIGVVQGQTPTQVARRIIGTKGAKYTDGSARKAFKNIESVILTVVNGIQSEARQALYQANADIVEQELYVATLDDRTTLECASHDGSIFERGKGPMPPLHFRCRSLRVPYISPENLGTRSFDANTEKDLVREYTKERGLSDKIKSRAKLPRGHKGKFDKFARTKKRELMGQLPGKINYNTWLSKQSRAFQDQVLGPTRGKMFREGQLNLKKFVARDGDVLTLDELRARGLEVPEL